MNRCQRFPFHRQHENRMKITENDIIIANRDMLCVYCSAKIQMQRIQTALMAIKPENQNKSEFIIGFNVFDVLITMC